MKIDLDGWSFRKIRRIIIFAFSVGYLLKFQHWPQTWTIRNIRHTIDFVVLFGILICIAVFLIMERREKTSEEDQDNYEDEQ